MKKTKLINIRVTEAERRAMHEQAKKRNVTLSQFVRLLVLQEVKLDQTKQNPPLAAAGGAGTDTIQEVSLCTL
ncbi:MAG TPA: hypothetical protein DEQ80_12130 [Anaerolinea thermolimosa]|uniref:Ribbon-helix-helix protein, CopG family n=1 Tax=Anaerolinea thermolimosa TaxID=229919 RepID=A0A3D1JLR0_9CHLR|nr:hypothetical protein [Anaerolinea thermolimosa]